MNNRSAWTHGLIWSAAIIAMSLYLLSSLKVVSDISQFMPASAKQPMLRALEGELEHGPAATILFVNIHGGDPDEDLRVSRAMQSLITADPGEIAYIRNGETQPAQTVLQVLNKYRYLLSAPDWSEQGLHQALLARLSDLRTGAGPVLGQYLLSDPYLSLRRYLASALPGHGPPVRDGVWYKSGVGALLLVKVQGSSLDLDRMQAAIQSLQRAFTEARPAANLRLQIAGPGAMAVASRAAIQQTIQWLSWVVVVLMLVVFWFAYRSLSLMLLASVPLFTAIIVGLSVTQLLFSHVHGIVLAFGMTLLGMCMDYPLHLFSHCRAQETPQTTMQRIWPTLRLGGISSAVAFLVLLGSGFNGLSQLAVFAASGILAALWVTRRFLPEWIKPGWIHPRTIRLRQGFAQRWQILAILLVACLPLAAALNSVPIWETHVDAISPVPASARTLDGELRKAMGATDISHLFVVEAATLEQTLEKTTELTQHLQALVQAKLVTHVEAVTRLLPSLATQRMRQRNIPSKPVLEARLTQAVAGTPFRADAFASFIDDAEASRQLLPMTLNDMQSTPMYTLARQGLIKTTSGWLSVIRIAGIQDESALVNWLQAHPDLAAYHIQTRQAVSNLMSAFRQAAAERVVLALILLCLLVWLVVRRFNRIWRIVVPVLLSVFASLSLPIIFHHSLTVFHLLAALLVMGMGLDYSLFFNREQHLPGEHEQSMHAIGISMLTTVVTFFVLAMSPIPVMSAMGTVIAAGIALCFILAWILAEVGAEDTEIAR